MSLYRQALRLAFALIATFFIAGCATPTLDKPQYAGRISVKVHTEPLQALSAGFALYGNAQRGLLVLTSPVGTTLARVAWTPEGASLDGGGGMRFFSSLDALALALTGTNLPVDALFAWLDGRELPVAGWQADLAALPQGILTARRTGDAPQADMRLVLER